MKKIICVLLIILLLISYTYTRIIQLNNKKIDVNNFSKYEIVEIYIIGIMMATLGYFISPEASITHFYLMSDGKDKKMISDFILKSKVVSKNIKIACKNKKMKSLNWKLDDLTIGYTYDKYIETRTSLALNGGLVDCSNGNPKILVDIKYPQKCMITFIKIGNVPILQIEEGLFYILQEKGIYLPYRAEYIIQGK